MLGEISLRDSHPLTYLLFPVLIWAALRFGQRGATLAVAVVAGLAIWNTTHYVGPFVFRSITNSVLSTQLFIAVAAVSTLCLVAVVSERRRLTREVMLSRARLVETSDRERKRLERNLHDGAQQRLIALAARLHGAAEVTATPQVADLLRNAEQEVKLATVELRELAGGLHPAVLTDLGLAAAIRTIAERTDLPTTIHGAPRERLGETTEATAYYVVAEAVANACKHANATHIWIRVFQFHTVRMLRVSISDDGRGGARATNGGGLLGLRDRVEAVGGTLIVQSPPHEGTTITAEIPI